MDKLQILSILLEIGITVIGVLIAVQKNKPYGWLIALTFAIYVFYDIARYLSLSVSQDILYLSFFVASVSILCFAWIIYQAEIR